jgi:hypothetical protein
VTAKRAIGHTKLKILAIIQGYQDSGRHPNGSEIWKMLQQAFHTYLEDRDLRNVYHHLEDLCELQLITKSEDNDGETLPRQLYCLSQSGEELKERYNTYLEICASNLPTHSRLARNTEENWLG